jgi:hypothetical protein
LADDQLVAGSVDCREQQSGNEDEVVGEKAVLHRIPRPVIRSVEREGQEETDRYWNAITQNGGEESACGWCKDKWGFSWQITPRVLLEAMDNPDRNAAKRAFQAMMTMRKIDIATIEAAIRGEPVNA